MPEVPPARAACSAPEDCAVGETCGSNATCIPGDCTFSGCVGGWKCDVLEGRWSCIPATHAGGAGQAGASASEEGSD